MEQDEGNHGNGSNGNEETPQNKREESSERETGEVDKMEGEGEAVSESKEGETEEEEPAAMETVQQDLFTLSAVNAYGSQEVKKIEDEPNKVYTLTSKSIAHRYSSLYLLS